MATAESLPTTLPAPPREQIDLAAPGEGSGHATALDSGRPVSTT